jgi:SAM-dependent methyltransferase
MTTGPGRVSVAWLRLREAADAAARAPDLAEKVQAHLRAGDRAVIHDLGCGTGSMGRWLAPRLPGKQHWILYDWDPGLLDQAAATMPGVRADGAVVTIETRLRDITLLDPGDVAGASLITASALLDMMTREELERLVKTCADAGCPALITMSVVGSVDLLPTDPLDASIASAFDAHQRRTTDGRRLLGPDAVNAATDAFTGLGADVLVRPSPWRLGPGQAALASEWLTGWVRAACEQRPELTQEAAAYLRRRVAQARAGRLNLRVDHQDLLVVP